MAIQFQCAACAQPIEIDEGWAGKPVACPYCQKTVTAPWESTFAAPQVPAARPLARGSGFPPPRDAGSAAAAYPVAAAGGNAVAVWAMALTLSALASAAATVRVLNAHADEMRPFVEMAEAGKSWTEVNRAFVEQFQGAIPGWLVGASLTAFLTAGLWLAGLICGVVAVRRQPRRGLALASLAISAVMAFFLIPRG